MLTDENVLKRVSKYLETLEELNAARCVIMYYGEKLRLQALISPTPPALSPTLKLVATAIANDKLNANPVLLDDIDTMTIVYKDKLNATYALRSMLETVITLSSNGKTLKDFLEVTKLIPDALSELVSSICNIDNDLDGITLEVESDTIVTTHVKVDGLERDGDASLNITICFNDTATIDEVLREILKSLTFVFRDEDALTESINDYISGTAVSSLAYHDIQNFCNNLASTTPEHTKVVTLTGNYKNASGGPVAIEI